MLLPWLICRGRSICDIVADQILFALFLPGPDLMLAASLYNVHECGERQFLFAHLDRLSPDLLLLDRGYPCRWLVAVLNHRAIKRVNHASAQTPLKPLLPILLLGARTGRKVGKLMRAVLDLIVGQTYRHRKTSQNNEVLAESRTRP